VSEYEVMAIEPAEARPLRRALLHPALPIEAVDYATDSHPSARHVGAFKDGVLVGIATIHPQPMPSGTRDGAWRLRDVAVEHGHRGRGIGAWMVERCLEHATAGGGSVAWCAARPAAVGFFDHLGFRRVGEPMDESDEGPEYVLSVELGPIDRDWRI